MRKRRASESPSICSFGVQNVRCCRAHGMRASKTDARHMRHHTLHHMYNAHTVLGSHARSLPRALGKSFTDLTLRSCLLCLMHRETSILSTSQPACYFHPCTQTHHTVPPHKHIPQSRRTETSAFLRFSAAVHSALHCKPETAANGQSVSKFECTVPSDGKNIRNATPCRPSSTETLALTTQKTTNPTAANCGCTSV